MNVHVPDAVIWMLLGVLALYVGRVLLGVVLMALWSLISGDWAWEWEQRRNRRRARRAERRAERRAVRDLD